MKIDVHSHYYPQEYIQHLKTRKTVPTVATDSQGRTVIHYKGDYNIVARGHVDPEERIRDMRRARIDMQVLTLTTPGTESVPPNESVQLAKATNDGFSRVVEKYPDNFTALATLPMLDPGASVEELRRAVKELGLKGACIFSNIAGKTLDSKEYWPVYAEAERLGVPVFIHPTTPIAAEAVMDYRLVAILGFTFDTSIAATRMIFSGLFEKHPNFNLVLAHLGGVLPYLAERIDNGYRAYPECKVNITKLPSHYLRKMYYDTVSFHRPALECAHSFLGPRQLMMGSDYPHQIGDLERAVTSIEELDIQEKDSILGENAARLLHL